MELSQTLKKRLAKEIILLFSGVMIWCFLGLLAYGYNSYQKGIFENLTTKEQVIQTRIDSLDPFKKFGGYALPHLPSGFSFLSKKDSINFTKDRIKDDSLLLWDKEEKQIHSKALEYSRYSYWEHTLKGLALFILFLLYPIRFTFIALQWAFKTVRE